MWRASDRHGRPPFVGAVRLLWWKRPFEEQLYRCAEGQVYSVRVSEEATTELHESVETWLRSRTADALERRPASSS